MIFVGVGEGEGVDALDGAGPEVRGDDVFADVEFRFGTALEAGNAAAIDDDGTAFGGDDEDGIALADVDHGDFELAGGDGGREGVDDECDEENADGGEGGGAQPGGAAGNHGEDDESGGEGEGEPVGRIGNTPIGFEAGEEFGDAAGEFQEKAGEPCEGCEVSEDGEEANDDDGVHDGDDEDVGGHAAEGDTVEKDGHGQGEGDLDDGGEHEDFVEMEERLDGEGDEGDAVLFGDAGPDGDGLSEEAGFDAHGTDVPVEIDVGLIAAEFAEAHDDGAGVGLEHGAGEGADGEDAEDAEEEAAFEELAGIEEEETEDDGGEGVEDMCLAEPKTAEEEESEPAGGPADGGGHAAGAGVGPGGEEGEDHRQGGAAGGVAEQDEEVTGEDGEVEAADDEGVIGAGAAVVFGPGLFQTGAFAGEDGLHHDGFVGVVLVERF